MSIKGDYSPTLALLPPRVQPSRSLYPPPCVAQTLDLIILVQPPVYLLHYKSERLAQKPLFNSSLPIICITPLNTSMQPNQPVMCPEEKSPCLIRKKCQSAMNCPVRFHAQVLEVVRADKKKKERKKEKKYCSQHTISIYMRLETFF